VDLLIFVYFILFPHRCAADQTFLFLRVAENLEKYFLTIQEKIHTQGVFKKL
jgi:hypothetical protein